MPRLKRPARIPRTVDEAVDRLIHDTQRLQFLQDHRGQVMFHGGTWSVSVEDPFVYTDKHPTLRDAIDAAMGDRARRVRRQRFPLGT